ncbi:DUF4244 domain-containing protein [Streptomyces nondiastaticus]|uniref:DUF4244 domain-containing protein n=1 Tax=Streptomyces nondiastaticus TaxID=3154512 RepID=UPI003F4DEDEC
MSEVQVVAARTVGKAMESQAMAGKTMVGKVMAGKAMTVRRASMRRAWCGAHGGLPVRARCRSLGGERGRWWPGGWDRPWRWPAPWRAGRPWAFAAGDAGMSTAEYAVGTVAACALAAVLYKVVTSGAVSAALQGLIGRALNAPF